MLFKFYGRHQQNLKFVYEEDLKRFCRLQVEHFEKYICILNEFYMRFYILNKKKFRIFDIHLIYIPINNVLNFKPSWNCQT